MGNVSRCQKLAGVPTASLDVLYHQPEEGCGKQNFMDILTPAGMALLDCSYYRVRLRLRGSELSSRRLRKVSRNVVPGLHYILHGGFAG